MLEGPTDTALLRSVARSGLVGSWLRNARDKDIGDLSFGYEIRTSDESSVIENAQDFAGRVLDDADWGQLRADFVRLEGNAEEVLRRNGVPCRNEGHSDTALVGTAWCSSVPDVITGDYWIPALNPLNLLLAAQSEGLNTSSGSLNQFDKDNLLYKKVSELGRQLIEVSVHFFDTEGLNLDEWEEILRHRPQLWGQPGPVPPSVNVIEKQLLDFNRVIGNPEPSGIYMSRVDGTPIYSAKCPGCKRIHGNFRTWGEASGNRMCKGCVSDFVDKTRKANETGNYRPLLKRSHNDKRKS